MRATGLRSLLGRPRPEPTAPIAAPSPTTHATPVEAPTGRAEPALACRAPFTSLHVDQFGDVRPCCQSSLVLGNLAEQTFDDIWTGEPVEALRGAMREGDLSLGCEHCAWAGRHGREATYAVRFDHDRLPDAGAGPVRLELAPSNACNLQCAMCNGDWSSSIRLHREGRPALERRFGAAQLAEVEAMAADLDEIHLFGGEPLLMPEALRLLEIAKEHGVRCTITTNGSILTPRVEALLDRPGVDLVVSVDGTSVEVYDAIRCGASWVTLQEHLDRFAELAARHGNRVDVAHCLMTANWHEFPDHLRWAAGRGLPVYVNDVLSPEAMSLHHLSPPELRAVVGALHDRAGEVEGLGASWRATWDEVLASLEQTLADGTSGTRHPHLGALRATTAEASSRAGAPSAPVVHELERLQGRCEARVDLPLDEQLRVRAVAHDAPGDRAPVLASLDLVGRPSVELSTLVPGAPVPEAQAVLRWDADEACVERRYRDPADGTEVIERRTLAERDGGVLLSFEYRRTPTAEERRRALVAATAEDRVVAIQLDADGRLAHLEPEDLARRLGLATEVGTTMRSPADALAARRADPPPTVAMVELDPGLVVVDLGWDDQDLIVVSSASRTGTDVLVASTAPLA